MCWWVRLGIGAIGVVASMIGAGRIWAASWVVAVARGSAMLAGEEPSQRYPAGAGYQLLVLLSAFEQAKLGILPLDVPVSVDAATVQEFSQRGHDSLPIASDKTYLLSDLLKAILLARSDLAAAAAAEAMWGYRDAAIEALNERAIRMGLVGTHVSSFSSDDPENVTTAEDLARLAAVLWSDHEEVRRWGTVRGVPFDDGRAVLANQNVLAYRPVSWAFVDRIPHKKAKKRLLQRVTVAVGIGAGMELVAARLGEEDAAVATGELVGSLQRILSDYELLPVVRAGEPLNVKIAVEGGAEPFVVPVAGEDARVPCRRSNGAQVEMFFQLPSAVTAPLTPGERLGEVVVQLDGRVVAVVPAVSPKAVRSEGVRSAGVGLR